MPSKGSRKKNSNSLLPYGVVIAVILVTLGAIFYVYRAQQLAMLPDDTQSALPQEELPPPTPTRPPREIPHGKWGFTVSTSQPGPKPGEGYLDPYDPAEGTKQTISLKFTDTAPIQKASVTIQTDNKTSGPFPFTKVDGTDENGTWEASWTVDDTYLYTYVMTFTATSKNGTSKVVSTFR